MYRSLRVVGVLGMALLIGLAALPVTISSAQSRLCFSEVPDCIEGRFAEYWQQNGGLPVFGFPIGPARPERVGDQELLVQPFERNRFELHPTKARPYDVLLGRLGDDRLRQLGRPWEQEPKAATTSQAGCQYFSETGHLVCEPFLSYWRTHGLDLDGKTGFTTAENLALFGLPLSGARMEPASDGGTYLTQWFERARFELHPELGPTTVLLGLLGREVRTAPAPTPPGPTPPAPDPAALPASVNATVTPLRGPPGTRFDVAARGFEPGERVGVYTTGPDRSVFGAPFQVTADANGSVEEVGLTMGTQAMTGIYVMTFEGISSGRKAFGYFEVTAATARPPDPGGIPAPRNAMIEPNQGPPGTVFRAVGLGFQPGERIGVYLTDPNQNVLSDDAFSVVADGEGASEPIGLNPPADIPRGIWAITFEGMSSGHTAVAYFRLLP